MAYRYGGGMAPEKKKKIAKAIVCSLLMLSVFSSMESTFAWHFVPWIYHLPSADPGIVDDGSDDKKFDWDLVKDTVNAGLDRLEAEERAKYGRGRYNLLDDFEGNDIYYGSYGISGGATGVSEHHEYHGSYYDDEYGWYGYNRYMGDYGVDKGYSNNGRNYNWQSYIWDYEGGKQIISNFNFDTVGGTIATWRRYGAGDWVKEPTGWGYGDDFAMYSRLFESTIPIRDMDVRASLNRIDKNLGKSGEDNIVKMLQSIKESTTSSTTEEAQKGVEQVNVLASFALKGDLKDLIGKLRNPKELLNGVEVTIKEKRTSVNPIAQETVGSDGQKGIDPLLGFGRGYTKEEIEQGANGVIVKEMYEHLDQTNKDASEAYNKGVEDLAKMREDLQNLMKKQGDGETESLTAAKQREENIHRAQIAIEKQEKMLDQMETRRQATAAAVERNRATIQQQYEKNQTHMPTAKEFAQEMREKREKYSTSHDLGYRRFGQSKKANFSKILDNVIEPKLEEQGKEEESNG